MARDIFMDDWLSRLLGRMNQMTLVGSFTPRLDRPLFKLHLRIVHLMRIFSRIR